MYRRVARFNKKSHTNVKPPYMIFNPHTLDAVASSLTICPDIDPWIQITAIDPGIKNCAIRTERRTYKDGKLHVQTLIQSKIDFTYTEDEDNTNDTFYYTQVLDHLSQFIPYFQTSHYILIESQLPINYDLVRMSQHLITYIMLYIKDQGLRPLIIEIDPKFKSRLFNAPPKMTKDELKKWAWENALKILKEHGDNDTVKVILEAKKKDDHGDVVCYTEGWWSVLTNGMYNPPVNATELFFKKI